MPWLLSWIASMTVWTMKTTSSVAHHQMVVCQGLLRSRERTGATADNK